MAKVIADDGTVIVKPWWARVRIIFTGAFLGLLWWITTVILKNYIVEPVACRDLANAASCIGSSGVAGAIATVIIAIIGAIILVRTLQPRPIVIAIAAAALLWSLGYYITGLAWYEGLLWAVLLYALTYVLFGLVARIVSLPIAIITAIVLVVVMRVLLAL